MGSMSWECMVNSLTSDPFTNIVKKNLTRRKLQKNTGEPHVAQEPQVEDPWTIPSTSGFVDMSDNQCEADAVQ